MAYHLATFHVPQVVRVPQFENPCVKVFIENEYTYLNENFRIFRKLSSYLEKGANPQMNLVIHIGLLLFTIM